MTSTPRVDDAVLEYSEGRGITEVMHFTTHLGLMGVLATGELKSRDLLGEDKYLAHIYTPNCKDRLKDPEWTGYVSMSISRVNASMLGYSKNWHKDDETGVWWAVLVYDASLLAHEGIYFTTTNNTYPVVKRGAGVTGLEALFANSVSWGKHGSVMRRGQQMPAFHTTDPQAEVLYPGALPVDWLRKIYVYEAENADAVYGWLLCFPDHPEIAVEHRPEVFQ